MYEEEGGAEVIYMHVYIDEKVMEREGECMWKLLGRNMLKAWGERIACLFVMM